MDILEANHLAHLLIGKHRLDGWTFRLNNGRRQLGLCREDRKSIELSRHYVLRNEREHVMDTLLHEIAHALVGTRHGHDSVWKEMCATLGCTARSCETSAVMPDGKWKAQCPSCRKIYSQHRRPRYSRGLYCRHCGPELGRLLFNNDEISYQLRRDRAGNREAAQLMLKLF